MSRLRSRLAPLVLLAGVALAPLASAHTGHGTHSLLQGLMHGLAHLFGVDQPLVLLGLLALLVVGLWPLLARAAARRSGRAEPPPTLRP